MITNIFDLIRDIHKTTAENVTSRVTRDKIVTKPACSARPPARQPARIRQSYNQFFPSENLVKNDPPWRPWIQTIFELNHRIQKTNVLTKFHEDWATNPCFSNNHDPFELVRDIHNTNVMTKCYDD
ncbi:hypothetical protein DPMN_183722 [Dreissena polymorpha]|uniref:Uncharacterized protein n=1 Tax=Dreissena polymorpha TaxID=45954 RepID=A0A9D4I5S8_DREPO|nr:hypothetical protein DPMN_183722 [Dreissena polymorpha]